MSELDDLYEDSGAQTIASEVTNVEFLTGAAGTGKTFTLKQRMTEIPDYGVLAATTGVAAVNLDTVTVNSLLGYFDTDSLKDRYTTGSLHTRLRRVREEYGDWLWIDEISMMHKEQLDLIYNAMNELNYNWADAGDRTLSLGITGDFCQLAPVKGRWVFESDCWPRFAAATTRLNKVWRQADANFLHAVNSARSGNGAECAGMLRQLGTMFATGLDLNFDGTTIVAKNDVADRFNSQRLASLPGRGFTLINTRWGKHRPEWKNIPERLFLKEGALVMILVNQVPDFAYVNGDLSIIHGIATAPKPDGSEDLSAIHSVHVQLKRTEQFHSIAPVTRYVESTDPPDEGVPVWDPLTGAPHRGEPFYDEEHRKWIYGGVTYFPLRLGYATTVHKSQGLTLDRVQIDCRDGFFGAPNMAYVAISRARSVEGLRVVGQPETLARRIKIDPAVRSWI